MTFSVVLDTCALYPAHLRDTMLRLTERGLYRALWSADIIEELRRNLIEVVNPAAVDRLLGQMTAAFPDAKVTGYQSLIEGLACDPTLPAATGAAA
ncbi:MAG: PIN domain-containing protein [Microthrixaceae bacterium]